MRRFGHNFGLFLINHPSTFDGSFRHLGYCCREKIEKDFDELSNQLAALRKNKDTLSGSITANQLQLEQEKTALSELSVQIETAIKNSEFESAEFVIQILKQELNLASEKQKVNQCISITLGSLLKSEK